MEKAVWLILTIPISALFTGLGIFAWTRKKPMWFWSGSKVNEREIADVPAYNRANGIMWIAYSAVFWASMALGLFNIGLAGTVLAVGCLAGIPILVVAYKLIYKKYSVKK